MVELWICRGGSLGRSELRPPTHNLGSLRVGPEPVTPLFKALQRLSLHLQLPPDLPHHHPSPLTWSLLTSWPPSSPPPPLPHRIPPPPALLSSSHPDSLHPTQAGFPFFPIPETCQASSLLGAFALRSPLSECSFTRTVISLAPSLTTLVPLGTVPCD